MTALWTFYTIPEPPLQRFLGDLRAALHGGDAGFWRALFATLDADSAPGDLVYRQPSRTGGKPVTCTEWYAGVFDLSAGVIPDWHSPSLRAMLREVTLRTAVARYVSRDSKPGMRFGLLDGADWADEEELEYERLQANIFRAGTSLPEPLDFLSGGSSAGVAWLVPRAVRNLLAAEEEAGLLERLGRELNEKNDPLGSDLTNLIELLRAADIAGLSVYYYEPGT